MSPPDPSAADQLPRAAEQARARATRPDATVTEGISTAVMLLSLGFIDQAGELLGDLIRLPPAGQNALMELYHRIRAGRRIANAAGFDVDEKASEILVAPTPGARRVILVFASGRVRYQEIDNPILQRRGDVSLIFIRDRHRLGNLAGIAGLGANYQDCIEGFQRIIAQLGASEIFCIGHSYSGYLALRFGLELGAKRVLATSPFTSLPMEMPERPVAPPELMGPLAPLYFAAEKRPQVTLCYGAENEQDCWMAEQMRQVLGVTLLPIPGISDHNSLFELNRTNRFGQLIEALLAD